MANGSRSFPITEGTVKLKERCNLTGIAINSDNKLLLCGYEPSSVYMYKDCQIYEDTISLTSRPWCITVVSNTEAVVTLPSDKSIQFITIKNTDGNGRLEIGERKKIGEECHGVTVVKDKIYLGGKDKVIILNTSRSPVEEIPTCGGINYNLSSHIEGNGQLLLMLRQKGRLCCINLDGDVRNTCDILGYRGLAVDQQGNAYIGVDENGLERVLPDGTIHDIVIQRLDVDNTRGLAFNNDFTKLFIIAQKGRYVLFASCTDFVFRCP